LVNLFSEEKLYIAFSSENNMLSKVRFSRKNLF